MSKDLNQLSRIGISEDKIEDLKVRTDTLRETQTLWIEDKKTVPEAQKQWEEFAKTAYALQDELLQTFRYAFRNHHELRQKVKWHPKRKNHAYLIQDLSNLAKLGLGNIDLLNSIGFDQK